ncbi:hypothetical protein DY000_02013591 [Brassica cretica]|uniref:DUF1985 domain-containing protein n=1 Tax=Brassica cretica TaxID=69181 RepID=A0ABQ7CXF8_BRACR|nr:hypothetical protein DY000_02013591 [Brassica cretica]
MRLGYLAIFTGFIEGIQYSTATRTTLARLAMDLENFENYPWGRVAFKVLMESLKGKDLESNSYTVDGFTQVLQTSVINFVQKDFGKSPILTHCEEGMSAAETESGVTEESGRPQKKARKEAYVEARVEASKVCPTEARSQASTTVGGMTKEQIDKNFRDIADAMRDGFEMCLKEIKLLGDMMEALEKKVGITKKGTTSNDLQITTSSPPKRVHEPGSDSYSVPQWQAAMILASLILLEIVCGFLTGIGS